MAVVLLFEQTMYGFVPRPSRSRGTKVRRVSDNKPMIGKNMSNLVVVGFNNAADAFQMRGALAQMQAQYLIEMEDAVVVTRDEKGAVQLHQAANLTAAGAVGGAFWGTLIGLLFLNPLLGAVVGAGSGALSGKLADLGIKDQFMKDLGATLTSGSAALFVLVRKSTPDKVLEGFKPFAGKGRVLQTSLPRTKRTICAN